jgi:uncharacterized membrane protein YeaQ/YmgE (transglycosylase-associated protein family)
VIGTIITVLVSGLVIGTLARWGVPGPDPMPLWLTFGFGYVGAVLGGGIAAAALDVGKDVSRADYFTIILSEIIAAMLLIILYRVFVQKRPITGPDAHRPPTRGVGVGRSSPPRARIELPGLVKKEPRNERLETLKRLDELHDQGLLTDEEYREKRTKVLREE